MVWGTHGVFRGTRAGFEIQICVLGMVVHWVIDFIPVSISFLIYQKMIILSLKTFIWLKKNVLRWYISGYSLPSSFTKSLWPFLCPLALHIQQHQSLALSQC